MFKARIFILEDDENYAEKINKALISKDYKVDEIPTTKGHLAKIIIDIKPDLLLLSISNPNQKNIFEIANQIHERADIPIVFLCSDDKVTLDHAALFPDMCSSITKPFNDKELIQTIDMAFYKKEMQQKLKESEERFKSLVDNSSIGIFRLSIEGRILLGNPKFINLLGFEQLNQVVGKKIDEFLNDGGSDKNNISELIKTKKQLSHYKLELRNSKNKKIFISLSGNAVSWENELLYFDGTIQDITKQVEYEMDLIEAKEKAEESDRLKTEFLAGMSHEIRTPINTIMSYLSLLSEDLKNSSNFEYEEIFKAIEVGSSRLTRTIDSILNMAQFQSGTFDTFKTKIDIVNEILVELYDEFKYTAEKRNLELNFINEAESTSILGDKYSLSQLFANLIDNGIKYTSKGSVKIRIYNDEDGVLSIDIKDTGIGISEEFLPNLFTPFTQEEQGYTRKFDGNGLGLALVKKYCELNYADIRVNSSKGEGTCFTVVFNNSNKFNKYSPVQTNNNIEFGKSNS